jgi:hypothetical protein
MQWNQVGWQCAHYPCRPCDRHPPYPLLLCVLCPYLLVCPTGCLWCRCLAVRDDQSLARISSGSWISPNNLNLAPAQTYMANKLSSCHPGPARVAFESRDRVLAQRAPVSRMRPRRGRPARLSRLPSSREVWSLPEAPNKTSYGGLAVVSLSPAMAVSLSTTACEGAACVDRRWCLVRICKNSQYLHALTRTTALFTHYCSHSSA